MGVMACRRSSCDSIMCHITACGRYICVDCFEELERLRDQWPTNLDESDVTVLIEQFFESEIVEKPEPQTGPNRTAAAFEKLVYIR